MKQSKHVIDSRQKEVLKYIEQHNETTVEEISKAISVSISTLRRDINTLQERGLINKKHGSVQLAAGSRSIYAGSKIRNALANAMAARVKDRETVFINTSSTALGVLSYLPNEHITVFTNNANAINTTHANNVQVILTGGELRVPKYSMVGDIAINTIDRIRASKCILGCNGISAANGVTTNNLIEAAVNEKMAANTIGEVYVLADHTKIGVDGNFLSVKLDKVNYLITDSGADPEQLELLKNAGIRVIVIDSEVAK